MGKKKKIAVIGAGGYIGRHLLSEIRKSPHLSDAKITTLSKKTLAPLYSSKHCSFNCISPDDYDYYELDDPEDFWVDNYGEQDITEPNEHLVNVLSSIRHFDVMINLAGSGRQSAANPFHDSIVSTASLAAFLSQRADIPNIIHMSGLGASEHTPIAYLAAKYEAESMITSARHELNYVVLRPSYVVGRGQDQLYTYVQQHKTSYNKGKPLDVYESSALIQPIHIDDVIEVILWAIAALSAEKKTQQAAATLDLVGPDQISFYDYMCMLAKNFDVPVNPITLEQAYCKALKSPRSAAFGVDDLGIITGGFVGNYAQLVSTTKIKPKSVVDGRGGSS